MKCKFYKKCKLFTKDSSTCTRNGGMYYADAEEPAGCYRRMEKQEE